MIEEIANLPEVSFIDNMTLDAVQEKMLDDYKKKYNELTGKTCSLKRADPTALILYACSVQIYQALLYVDRAGKQDLLKYAYGDYLDNLAALKGISREPAKPAAVMVRFTLSEVRPYTIPIPAGTRITNGDIYFATDRYAEILPGQQNIDISCTCLIAGTDGNGLLEGELNILVDPVPYVANVQNIEYSSGGTDVEADEDLAYRVYIAPSSYSVAGPEQAYMYWVKTYNASILDIRVDSENPTEVQIQIIMENGELPNASLVQGLQEYLSGQNIRPLTDKVMVSAPGVTEYDMELEFFINVSDKAKAMSIQAQVDTAILEYEIWQKSKIGRDINPSELIKRIVAAGAKRAVVNKPDFQIISKSNVAVLRNKTVSYGGIEDD
ncbi:MAG: baseplate J/gp47 family protein [Lachnospiraceae bacterium]|nr:baseplate J/gp47 family protein [Lachnospiraceae bacterium]